MTDDEVATAARLFALRSVSGIGNRRVADLLDRFGRVDAILDAPFSAFEQVRYVDRDTYARIADLDDTVATYCDRLARTAEDVTVVPLGDDRYPDSVRRQNAPVVLFAQGDLDLLTAGSVSFTGSREANDAALAWTAETSATLAAAGYVVVSGGALGVDTAAHEAALDAGGGTVAVLPGGLTDPTPAANAELFDRVRTEGLLLSQNLPDEEPTRFDYLERNATNSALSRALVVGAAGASGGTMSQYRDAVSQGRDVFVPATDLGIAPDDGIDEMIDSSDATPVTTGDDVLAALDGGHSQSSLVDWDG